MKIRRKRKKLDDTRSLQAKSTPNQENSNFASANIQKKSEPSQESSLSVSANSGFNFANVAITPPSGAFTPIQTKMEIGSANDRYEQEADQVADRVVSAINSPAPRPESPPANNPNSPNIQNKLDNPHGEITPETEQLSPLTRQVGKIQPRVSYQQPVQCQLQIQTVSVDASLCTHDHRS